MISVKPGMLRATKLWTVEELSSAQMSVWLDGADAGSISLSTTKVTQWSDKSGNSRHFTQGADANRPVYDSANGRVDFTGSTAHLFNTSPFMYGSGAIDIYAVTDSTRVNGGYLLSESRSTDVDAGSIYGVFRFSSTASSGDMTTFIRNAASVVEHANTINYGTGFGGSKQLWGFSDSGSLLSHRLNGGTAATSSYTRSGSHNEDRLTIGGLLRSTFVGAMSGYIHEIVILPSLAATALRQKIEGYLSHRHGVTLASGHPFKDKPPYK